MMSSFPQQWFMVTRIRTNVHAVASSVLLPLSRRAREDQIMVSFNILISRAIDAFNADQDCQMDSVYRTNVFDLCFLRFMDLNVKKTSSLI